MTRPEPLRVTVPEDVTCTLCSRAIPDDQEYEAQVIGSQQDDECFLLLMCERCSARNMVIDGGEA